MSRRARELRRLVGEHSSSVLFFPGVSRLQHHRDAWSELDVVMILARRIPRRIDPWTQRLRDLEGFEQWGPPWPSTHSWQEVTGRKTVLVDRGRIAGLFSDPVRWSAEDLSACADSSEIRGILIAARPSDEPGWENPIPLQLMLGPCFPVDLARRARDGDDLTVQCPSAGLFVLHSY